MIRIISQKRCAIVVGMSALASFFSTTPVFAQIDTAAVLADSISFLQSPAGRWMLLGIIVVLLVINILIVFLINPKQFPRKEMLMAAWPLTKKHLWLLIGTMIFVVLFGEIPTLVTAIVQNAMSLSDDEPISNIVNILGSLMIAAIVKPGFIALTLHCIDGVSVRFTDLFSKLAIFWRFLAASILYGLPLLVGFILFIVPGVYWMMKYSLWPYFLVDKKVSVIESFAMSARATQGYKWSLLSVFVFLGAMNVLGLCVFLVGLLVTVPLSALILTYVYRKFVPASPSGAPPEGVSIPSRA